jgi:predicted 3-demethylubiquinone-9 3-methyltransferase (glyoxalase superfamily)
MELGEYPFSKYYGWVQDKYGYSWQLMLNNPEGDKRPKIVPSLMFTKDKDGQAEDAMKFYTSVFKESEISKNLNHYPSDMPDRKGKISYADFRLFDQWFAVMDGGDDHDFSFTPAISLMVSAKIKKKLIITGKNYQQTLNLNNVVGLKINMVSVGKLHLRI